MSVGVAVALALGVLNLLLWFCVALLARRTWRQVRPQLEPLLTMFAPQPASEVDAFVAMTLENGSERE